MKEIQYIAFYRIRDPNTTAVVQDHCTRGQRNLFTQLWLQVFAIFVSTACEDGQLGAHKAVLSAGSPLFRQILRQNPHAHPLLYLRGLKQVPGTTVIMPSW